MTRIPGKIFFWGASIASHQVEGGNHNQWTVWESKNSKKLAQVSKKKLTKLKNWESIKERAEDPENYISGKGVDHYHLYKTDFDLAKQIGLNSMRISIEWSRIEPFQGEWNQEEINYYKKYIHELKERGLTPFLNLWHWTVPVWFSDKGGFEKNRNLVFFNKFIEKISEDLLDEIDYVLVLNETNVYSTYSYLSRQWPPEGRNIYKAIKVNRNLVKVYKTAYMQLKTKKPNIQVGFAQNLSENIPSNNNLITFLTTKIVDQYWNWWFLDMVKDHTDFIGINYYFTNYINFFKISDPIDPTNDMGWYMNPAGIYDLSLKVWKRYSKPMIISENGVADEKDIYRTWWIEETINSVNKLRAEGVDIFGYMHWSLIDNFEWAYGWWPKFGLISVDRTDMSRKIRGSAYIYSKLIKSQSDN